MMMRISSSAPTIHKIYGYCLFVRILKENVFLQVNLTPVHVFPRSLYKAVTSLSEG